MILRRLRNSLTPRSLYSRLSLALWLIVFILTGAQFILLFHLWRTAHYERVQHQAWNLAEEIAKQARTAIQQADTAPAELSIEFERIHRLNSNLDLYLLASDGRVLVAHTKYDETVALVPTGAIEEFLRPTLNRKLPLYGPDPSDPKLQRVFSAARARIGDKFGYVYVILSGAVDRVYFNSTLERYLIFGGILISVVTAIGAGGLGSTIFSLMTRRFRRLIKKLDRMTEQNLTEQIPVEGNDEVAMLAIVINRLTDRIAEGIRQLKRTDELRRELVATVTHDFNEPITTIHTHFEVLLRQAVDLSAESQREHLQAGLATTKRLSTLVEDLFELSKLEARDKQAEPIVFDLRELLEIDILPAYHLRNSAFKVEVTASFCDQALFVSADVDMVQRILLNLVDNAVRYGRDGGRVVLSADVLEGKVWITVQDDGPGIPAADLPHVFEPFFRGSSERLNRKEGSGLGLAIVRKLVEAHGSVIDVESTAGKGTCFRFWLPAVDGSKTESTI